MSREQLNSAQQAHPWLGEAVSHLQPVRWSRERQEAVRGAIHRRRRRFALSTVGLSSAAVAVAVAIALFWLAQGQRDNSERTLTTTGDSPPPASLALRDGTRAVSLSAMSEVRLVRESPEVATFALERGKAWFEVTPSRTRRVEVRVHDVHVEVLGTEFVVEVRGEDVHVWVHRGTVAVHSGTSKVLLETGDHESFPKTAPVVEKARSEVSVVEDSSKPKGETRQGMKPTAPQPGPDAPEAIVPIPDETTLEPPTVDELWKRADGARKRADYGAAIAALRTLVNGYPDDGRAALAAFSLGRVLLDSGGSAKTAARAFAKARKLSPEGPLVEDALLREVEAWLLAGDMRRVRSRTKKYLRQFPNGRYRKQVLAMAVEE